MQNKATYEWCLEQIDKHGDIQDLHWGDKLADIDTEIPAGIERQALCLVRDLGNEEDGLVERCYAYTKAGEFTTGFREFPEQQDQHSVPARYKKELASVPR